jgi:hypothetical protein
MAMAPANYSGLANLMNLQGVGVNPTSQLAYVPSKDLMTRYQTIPNPRTGIPQAMGVTGMAEGGMPSQQYPMQEEAMELANRGRYGDTTLVHMTPGEVQGLASLGQLTINPDTGLPEAFNMKALLPIVAGIAGSILLPYAAPALVSALGATGAGAVGAGLGTFGGGLLAGQKPGEAALGGVTSGLMSFGIGSILGGASPGLTEGTTATLSPDVISSGMIDPLGEGIVSSAASSPINIATGKPILAASLSDPSATISASGLGEPSVYEIAETSKMLANQPVSSLSEEAITSGMLDPLGEGIIAAPKLTPTYSLSKAYEPGTFGKLIGKEAIPAGDITREQFIQLGGTPSDATFKEIALQKAKDPFTYTSLGIAALTGGLNEPYEYEKPAARPAPDTGFDSKTLKGGEVRRPVATEEELRRMALEGGRRNYFNPYTYVRNAAPNETLSIKRNVFDSDKFKNVAEGGIVGLQQGGMATPQAPSAMAGMLAQPQPQQPLPTNVQVQPQQPVMPQQPQPSMPMPQTGSGVTPLPDQQKEFMKLMDMEDQVQSQKRSQSTQALASIMGLGMNFAGNQYPQTSPSGQAVQPPPTPPMNYGSQVNMGLAAGGQPYFEGQVQGPGDGQSDEVAFRVDGGQVDGAMLSPQEYVLAADVVSAIGNGSSDAGAAKLDQFMKGVRQDAYGTTKQMQPFNNQGLTNLVA